MIKSTVTFILLLQSLFVFSNNTLTLLKEEKETNLKEYCYHFEDTSHKLSIKEVLNSDWEKFNGIQAFPSNKHIQWMRYDVYNPYPNEIERIVFIPYFFIHKIDLYTVVNSSISKINETGIMRSVDNKHFESIGYPIKIKLAAKETTSVVIRFQHLYRPLRATAFLMTNDRVENVIQKDNILIWFWRGVFVIALCISLCLYFFVRLKLFLYYFVVNIGFGFFIGAHIGDYFWFSKIDSTDLNSLIDIIGAFLIVCFLPKFLNALVPVKERNKTLWKWMYYFIYIMPLLILINIFSSIRTSEFMYFTHFYFMILSALVLLMLPILLIKNIYKKDKSAKQLFLIYSLFVLSSFVDVILPNIGLVDDSPHVYSNLLMGSFFEMFCFMFLMGRETLKIFKDREVLLEKQKKHQKEMIFSIVKSQEEERNKLGRELHDLIGGNMSIIKQKIEPSNFDLLNIVNKTIDSVRNLSHSLVTPTVKSREFIDEIKELCYLFSSEKQKAHVYFHNWPEINDPQITTHLYRILQELLQNASKHSNAKNVYLQFMGEDNGGFRLIYEDDGIGFDSSEVKTGLGLKNIKNRSSLINGSFLLDSSTLSKGTSIIIEVT